MTVRNHCFIRQKNIVWIVRLITLKVMWTVKTKGSFKQNPGSLSWEIKTKFQLWLSIWCSFDSNTMWFCQMKSRPNPSYDCQSETVSTDKTTLLSDETIILPLITNFFCLMKWSWKIMFSTKSFGVVWEIIQLYLVKWWIWTDITIWFCET